MTQKTSKKSLSRIQLLIFRLLALVVVPVVLLLGIELGLRLFGFGYSTDFFVEAELDGQQYWRKSKSSVAFHAFRHGPATKTSDDSG